MDNLEFEKDYQKYGFSAQRRYPNEALIQFFAEHYFHLPREKRKNCRVLELGCGSGANLWMIAREGFSVFGIDIAETGIELCEKTMKAWGVSADLRVGNIKKLDFKDNYFDAIVDTVSIQHTDMAGHIKTFKEARRCLKKGGRFFSWHIGAKSISFSDGGGKHIDKLTLDKITNPGTPIQSSGAICFLTLADAMDMLKIAGFKDINIEVVTRTYKNTAQLVEYLSVQAQKM